MAVQRLPERTKLLFGHHHCQSGCLVGADVTAWCPEPSCCNFLSGANHSVYYIACKCIVNIFCRYYDFGTFIYYDSLWHDFLTQCATFLSSWPNLGVWRCQGSANSQQLQHDHWQVGQGCGQATSSWNKMEDELLPCEISCINLKSFANMAAVKHMAGWWYRCCRELARSHGWGYKS